MCLILFAYRTLPDHALIIAANRDEFHGRASTSISYWDDHPQVLAGRDLVAGGTWLGCTRQGRFAGLTNFSQPDDPPAPRSRGVLVQDFLSGESPAEEYAHSLNGGEFAGYNLLLFDGAELVYTSNRGTTEVLHPGYYGLSNAELGAEWPKCVQGSAALKEIVEDDPEPHRLLKLLANSAVPEDELLPHRGRPIELERRVAPCFIVGDEYGTRASSVLKISDHRIDFSERSYGKNGTVGEIKEFDLDRH